MKQDQLIATSYTAHRRQLLLYLSRYTKYPEDAQDLVQDIFVQLLGYEKLICPATVTSFIFTIARNALVDYLRRRQREQAMNSYLYDTTPDNDGNYVERQVIAADLKQVVMRRIARLPDRRRKVFLMHRLEARSVADISQALHLSPRTVESHLYIGSKEVRAYVKQCI